MVGKIGREDRENTPDPSVGADNVDPLRPRRHKRLEKQGHIVEEILGGIVHSVRRPVASRREGSLIGP